MDAWVKVAVSVFIVIVGVIAFSNVYFVASHFLEPLRIVSTTVEHPVVKFGDAVVVTHKYIRNSYCKVDIDRFIISLPDQILVRRERLPAGTTQIGTFIRRIRIPTKFPDQLANDPSVQDLHPGREYLLREFIHSDCGDRIHSTIAPDATFRVVE